ncbi:olfactory receptor 478 [Nannospalax galili]|uniref:olfactory receptor 478 n=1 Tax=Nannospalax galili TaxID=1026970 RepID=UPI00111BD106|nr:olfactory receptor 478 [Nannospalax galili]
MTDPKDPNSSATELRDAEVQEMLEEEVRSLLAQMTNGLEEDTKKEVNSILYLESLSWQQPHCPMALLVDGNHTAVTEFTLLGLTDDPVLRVILFIIVLCIYPVTLSGNLGTILLIRVSPQLSHPMYFFLSRLASTDIGSSSSVTPNTLVNFLGRGILSPGVPVAVTSFSSALVIVITVLVIALSYIYILLTILKMHSTEGRQKAFSTCTSHLTAVILYYGTVTFIYVMPSSSYPTDQNKVISVFYIVVIPMLNPIIYSLMNNEIKGALKRQFSRKIFS